MQLYIAALPLDNNEPCQRFFRLSFSYFSEYNPSLSILLVPEYSTTIWRQLIQIKCHENIDSHQKKVIIITTEKKLSNSIQYSWKAISMHFGEREKNAFFASICIYTDSFLYSHLCVIQHGICSFFSFRSNQCRKNCFLSTFDLRIVVIFLGTFLSPVSCAYECFQHFQWVNCFLIHALRK